MDNPVPKTKLDILVQTEAYKDIAYQYDNGTPKVDSWGQVDKLKFPENPWRVKNLIPKGGTVILASESGSKKTFIAMQLAHDIAAGRDFLGAPEFLTTG